MRPPGRLREAANSPLGYVSFRAIRGYRPGDYFTRGTSVGGNTRAGSLAGTAASVHPGDGFTWTPSTCTNYPKISACSRFNHAYQNTPAHVPHAAPPSEEFLAGDPDEGSPPPPPCVCRSYVETKPVTSDAFTMTETRVRDQGTSVDLQTADKSIATTLTTRDVFTEIEDEIFDMMEADPLYRLSNYRLSTRSRSSVRFK
ncbi:hypothetical protein PoB_005658900 [Plakobranchus ocellatus]|uniref:Uncharacterized protein n=1 Tax=Plakobranchus ocellatus TaxID=259542 RepID=A0AAV4CFZ3_9GAST|nr:hypothetical protein PoB_005658900 [Plakobranchus ocellatus]